MRPPAHWHAPRARRGPDFTWWVIVGALAVVVAVALVGRAIDASNDATPGATTVGAEDAVPPSSEVLGAQQCGDEGCPTPAETPVVVASTAAAPSITARAAVVMEASCGAVLYAKNQDAQFPPASLTKVVTALVADDLSQPDELVSIQVNGALMVASTGSTVMGLEPGQEMTMRDLLHGLLLASGNDAAIAIAEHVAGNVPEFVDLMNEKAAELGLEHSRFSNPHGLDQPEHYSSAFDMASFGREALANPRLAAIVRTQKFQPAWSGPQVWNGNELVGFYRGAIGVKIGYTEKAGQTIVAAAERDGRTVIVSLLRSWQRYTDSMALMDWAFDKTENAC
jgi:serine-type D-Ala-D-Ala carboxypeptidase (penicillin-binding protein 5/6)